VTGLFLFIPIKYLASLLSVAIAVGLYCFFLGFLVLAHKSSLLTIRTSKIGSATQGLVEVSGVAAGPRTTLAPITGEPCFLYHTTVWQQSDGKKNEWENVADETLYLPFFIDDLSGQMLIEALGADLDLHPRFRGEYAASLLDLDHVPPSVSVFLSRHGIALDRNVCIEERLIKAEDALFVAGTLTENPAVQAPPSSPRSDAGTGQRNPVCDIHSTVRNNDRRNPARDNSSEPILAPELIRLSSVAAPSSTREMSQQAKIAAALSRAGITNPQDWPPAALPYTSVAIEDTPPATDYGRSDLRLRDVRLREAHPDKAHSNDDRSESSGFNLIPPVVLMKGANNPTFLISYRSRKKIVSALAWKSAALVCGGTAITLLGLYLMWAQIALL
jgi:hypothetical protein